MCWKEYSLRTPLARSRLLRSPRRRTRKPWRYVSNSYYTAPIQPLGKGLYHTEPWKLIGIPGNPAYSAPTFIHNLYLIFGYWTGLTFRYYPYTNEATQSGSGIDNLDAFSLCNLSVGLNSLSYDCMMRRSFIVSLETVRTRVGIPVMARSHCESELLSAILARNRGQASLWGGALVLLNMALHAKL